MTSARWSKRAWRSATRSPNGRQRAAGRRQGVGVPVEAEELEVRVGLEERAGVAAAADGGVDEQPGGHRAEEVDDLVDHHRLVTRSRGSVSPRRAHVRPSARCREAVVDTSGSLICSPPTGGARRDFSPIELDGKRAE